MASFSVIGAANKAEAVLELDEIGNTDGAEIRRMPACMLDFEIVPPDANHEIGLESLIRFSGFGEETRGFVLEKAYPKLNETLATALEVEETDTVAARKLWAEAVEIEMHRVHHKPVTADTELARRIQNQAGMSGVVANAIVRKVSKLLLESMDTDSNPKQ
jgi:lambda repressor-like predicted transcriptional regulator